MAAPKENPVAAEGDPRSHISLYLKPKLRSEEKRPLIGAFLHILYLH